MARTTLRCGEAYETKAMPPLCGAILQEGDILSYNQKRSEGREDFRKMSFSLFSALFLSVVTVLFYLLRKELRVFVLVAASLCFVAHFSVRGAVWLIAVSLAVYAGGLLLQKTTDAGKKEGITRTVILLNAVLLLLLAELKLAPVIVPYLFSAQDAGDAVLRHLLLPLGFSYYVFQAVGYLVDISRGTIRAEKNLLHFLLYMCFFPKVLSGPIERAGDFTKQLKRIGEVRITDAHRFSRAAAGLLYGFFMKTVLADRLAIYTPRLLNNPQAYGSFWLFMGMLLYTMQIYCDFAGYSAIAMGTSELFGINLTENFHAPYLSPDITVFWRRWHRSLSLWLRDYLYIPLGGGRKGLQRKCVNTLIVFVLCGLWHGTGWQFLIWGLLHGMYSVAHTLFRERRRKKAAEEGAVPLRKTVLFTLLTFLAVAFAWIFFGSPDAGTAFVYIRRMITFPLGGESPGIINLDKLLLLLFLPAVFVFDALCLKKEKPFADALQDIPYVRRYLLYYGLILVIFLFGIYGPAYDATNFMYMEF
ncbi:MAG: MBOAT family protein [Lachnospiraceae bacterium]|nr:MBOAT family protein [Lachnospiraceae bacterium]